MDTNNSSNGQPFVDRGAEEVKEAVKSVFTGDSNTPIGREKAPLGIRILAYLIDGVIVGTIYGIFSIIISLFAVAGSSVSEGGGVSVISYVMIALVGLAVSVYYLIRDGLFEGQSIGKRVMKLQVINVQSGRHIGYGPSVLRNLGMNLFGGLTVGIGYLILLGMAAFREDGRHLGDLIGGTMVVKQK